MLREQFHRINSSHLIIVLMVVSGIISVARLGGWIDGYYVDDAHYIIDAQSLTSGRGQTLINFPDAPVDPYFPIGWPLLLVPITYLFPGNYAILKIMTVVLWLASIPLAYKISSNRLTTPFREVLIILIALHPTLLLYSRILMSEVSYLFFTLLAIYLLELSETRKWLLGLGLIVAIFSWQIRAIGLSLLLAILLLLAWRRNFRRLLIAVIILGSALLIQTKINQQLGRSAINWQFESALESDPISSVLVTVQHTLTNFSGYINYELAHQVMPVFGSRPRAAFERFGLGSLFFVLNIVLVGLIASGFLIRSFQRATMLETYLVVYLAAVLSFWWPSGTDGINLRLLMPIIPLFLYYFLVSIETLSQRFLAHKPRIKQATAIVIGIIFIAPLMYQNLPKPSSGPGNIVDIRIGRAWLSDHAPMDSIVMTPQAVPDYLYVRRLTVNYPNVEEETGSYIRDHQIDYVILAPDLLNSVPYELDDKGKIVEQFITTHPDMFIEVFSDPSANVTVYEVSTTET